MVGGACKTEVREKEGEGEEEGLERAGESGARDRELVRNVLVCNCNDSNFCRRRRKVVI